MTLESLQQGLTVSLIATKRENLSTCQPEEEISVVVDRNRQNRFDFLPVVRRSSEHSRSEVIGLLGIAPFTNGFASGQVQEHMRGLSDENLIGADASILTFVRFADQQKCRLIVSGHAISGLVSQSDLQRLPVRAALFGMVTYLELILIDVIRAEFRESGAWLQTLAFKRRKKLDEQLEIAQAKDGLVDPLLFTQFADKMTIIGKHPALRDRENEFLKDMRKIQALRDGLAHANDYASSPEKADRTCQTVRLIDLWASELLGINRNADATKLR